MSGKQKLLLLSILVTVFTMVLIFFFSSQSVKKSDHLSRGVAQRLLELISVDAPAQTEDQLNHILRKTAHFTLYFVLGCGLFGIVIYKLRRIPMVVGITVLLGFLYAVSDEFHQSFIAGRCATVQDVLLDTSGVTAGALCLAVCNLCMRWKRKPVDK